MTFVMAGFWVASTILALFSRRYVKVIAGSPTMIFLLHFLIAILSVQKLF